MTTIVLRELIGDFALQKEHDTIVCSECGKRIRDKYAQCASCKMSTVASEDYEICNACIERGERALQSPLDELKQACIITVTTWSCARRARRSI